MRTHVFRFKKGDDLRQKIESFASENRIKAGVILTCVGNLTKAVLRMAKAKEIRTWDGKFEIVSLVGTFEAGNSHLHICLSDDGGSVFGGHLKQGSLVGGTAEVCLGEIEGLEFGRELDKATGYEELVIKKTT